MEFNTSCKEFYEIDLTLHSRVVDGNEIDVIFAPETLIDTDKVDLLNEIRKVFLLQYSASYYSKDTNILIKILSR